MTDIPKRCSTCVHWFPAVPSPWGLARKPAMCRLKDSPQFGKPTEGGDVCEGWQTKEMLLPLPIYAPCPHSSRGIHETISRGEYHVCETCGARSLKKRWWICYDETKMDSWAVYCEHLTPSGTRYEGPFELYVAEGQLLKRRGHRRGR